MEVGYRALHGASRILVKDFPLPGSVGIVLSAVFHLRAFHFILLTRGALDVIHGEIRGRANA